MGLPRMTEEKLKTGLRHNHSCWLYHYQLYLHHYYQENFNDHHYHLLNTK